MSNTSTIVVKLGGTEGVDFSAICADAAELIKGGQRLVLVHGARPQIEARLKQLKHRSRFANGLRVTDDIALSCAKEASGRMRVEIEALIQASDLFLESLQPRYRDAASQIEKLGPAPATDQPAV